MHCRPGISSMSLGRCYAGHSFAHKLTLAAKHGIQGIEIFYEDLVSIAAGSERPHTTPSPAAFLSAANYIHQLCTSLDLHIINLQPFMHYEGLLDRKRHEERIQEMKLWIEMAHIMGTDLIQVPSSFLSDTECSGDIDLIVKDLTEIAELGLQQTPTIRFAYESLAWSTHINTWEQCWSIVQRVNRPNFGICLDTYNILGRIYADPTSPNGLTENAEQEVEVSMRRLVSQIGPHKDKIFFIQVVDGERLSSPLVPGHPFYNAEQPARMSWSRNCRLFYGEKERGAYLPVERVLEAIFHEIGWEGWVSSELFNRDMERRGEGVVEELAERAGRSWEAMVRDFGLLNGGEGKREDGLMRRDSPVDFEEDEGRVQVARL